MKVRVDGRELTGAAVGLPDVDPDAVFRAIRGEGSPVAVRAPDPGPVHDHVGLLAPDLTLSLGPALAAVARSLGHEPPQADRIADLRERIADLSPPEVDREAARRRAAEAGAAEDRLHERVAELRGRVRTLEDRGEDPEAARQRLREAAAELTDARTERIAAQERLDRLDRRVRAARDRREKRLRLRDRLDNRRRDARKHLARAVHESFAAAVEAVPGAAAVGDRPGSYEGDDLTAALALARVADLNAPVVVACGRFSDAESARECLDASVIRVTR